MEAENSRMKPTDFVQNGMEFSHSTKLVLHLPLK